MKWDIVVPMSQIEDGIVLPIQVKSSWHLYPELTASVNGSWILDVTVPVNHGTDHFNLKADEILTLEQGIQRAIAAL